MMKIKSSMILIAFALLFLIRSNAFSETIVGGSIISNTTWSLSGSPFIVTGNIIVNAGVVLSIEAGVLIKFDGNYCIEIKGSMIAIGSPLSPIKFTSNKSNPAPGDWGMRTSINYLNGINFADSSIDATYDVQGHYLSGSVLQYCVIEYGSGVSIEASAPYINNCTIMNSGANGGAALLFTGYNTIGAGASPRIVHNMIIDNKNSGFHLINGKIIFEENYIMRNHAASNSPYPTQAIGGSIKNNTIAYNDDSVALHYNILEIHQNNFFANGEWDVVNKSASQLDLTNNYWGTIDPKQIEERIFDAVDNIDLGQVIYSPFLSTAVAQIFSDPNYPIPSPGWVDVKIISPKSEETVKGSIDIKVKFRSYYVRNRAEIYIDGILKISDSTYPYSYLWDTTTMANGAHIIKVKGYDNFDNSSEISIVSMINNGGDSIPSVSIIFPQNGTSVKGIVNIQATASDDKGISKVDFFIDDVMKGQVTALPYTFIWDTTNEKEGEHTIKVVAYDTINQSASASMVVRVYNQPVQAELKGAIVVFINNQKKLRKIDLTGTITQVINTDPDIEQIQFDPSGNLLVVFSVKQVLNITSSTSFVRTREMLDDKNPYLMIRINPFDNSIAGIDTDLSQMVILSKSISPNIQFDVVGSLYYLAKNNDGKTVLRRYVSPTNIVNLINDNINIKHWFVNPDGIVLIGGETSSTLTPWLRRISPSGEISNIATPAEVGWILRFPDLKVYAGLPNTGGIYQGVYRLSESFSYLGETQAKTPYMGFREQQWNPEYDVLDLAVGHDPVYSYGLTGWGGVYLFSYAETKDGKYFGLTGNEINRTVVRFYPAAPEIIELKLVDRVTLLRESLGQLIIPGTKNGLNKLILYDLASKIETNLLYENIEIYHLDILSNGSILFDGLNFSNNKNIVGMLERASDHTPFFGRWQNEGSKYNYKQLSELNGKPINFLVLEGKDTKQNPEINLNKHQINFSSVYGDKTIQTRSVFLENGGAGELNWQAFPDHDWLVVSPSSGIGNANIQVTIQPQALQVGFHSGIVRITDPNAVNSPQDVSINLYIKEIGTTSSPFGELSTPEDKTMSITGAIPVTGWVLDDIETTKVEIWRDPVGAEGPGLIFIGNAIFVEGARPDIEQIYSEYPFNYRAGWGYMLLTNFLPNQGNGTYKLYAFATDKEGNQVLLGSKTITCANATAVKPFGTIDTPTQGGDASGNMFVNFGWVLTPMPKTVSKDGTTIEVYVDSVKLGNLATVPNVYNQYRVDVATAFPGLNNTGAPGVGGPVGAFFLDTTKYANGVHTIHWIARDDAGAADGIGSRYFNIVNTGTSAELTGDMYSLRVPGFSTRRHREERSDAPIPKIEDILKLPLTFAPLWVKTGFDLKAEPATILPDNLGVCHVQMGEVEPLELFLNPAQADQIWNKTAGSGDLKKDNPPPPPFRKGGEDTSRKEGEETKCAGYLRVGVELRPLPIGSTLDSETGLFSWLPGPGFIGTYDLLFLQTDEFGITRRILVKVTIRPKFHS